MGRNGCYGHRIWAWLSNENQIVSSFPIPEIEKRMPLDNSFSILLWHGRIISGSAIDGRRFALCGGTVTLWLHRNRERNWGKHRNSRPRPKDAAILSQNLNRANRISAVPGGCLLPADALFSIDIVAYANLKCNILWKIFLSCGQSMVTFHMPPNKFSLDKTKTPSLK